MKIRMVIAVLVAVIASVLTQASASAETTARPTVTAWKVYPNAGRVAIQIEGARNIWGIRKFGAEANRQIPGLRIYTSGTCAQRPWATCVRVRAVYRRDVTWYGVARWKGKYQRVILLNNARRKSNKYPVAVHELGHVIGLNHHRSYGILGRSPNVVHLSWRERRALNQAY